MTVAELCDKLDHFPLDATVLLVNGPWSIEAANEATFGVPEGLETYGANEVIQHDERNVYIVHAGA